MGQTSAEKISDQDGKWVTLPSNYQLISLLRVLEYCVYQLGISDWHPLYNHNSGEWGYATNLFLLPDSLIGVALLSSITINDSSNIIIKTSGKLDLNSCGKLAWPTKCHLQNAWGKCKISKERVMLCILGRLVKKNWELSTEFIVKVGLI